AGEAIVSIFGDAQNAEDRWIPDAATCAAAKNGVSFLKALPAKESSPRLLAAISIVAEHYARGGPADTVGDVLVSLTGADVSAADAAVRGMARGWPGNRPPKLDTRVEDALEKLVNKLSPERRGMLVRLAGSWGSKRFEAIAVEAARLLLTRVT